MKKGDLTGTPWLIGLFLIFPWTLNAAALPVPVRVAVVEKMTLQKQIILPGLIGTQKKSSLSSRVDAMAVAVNVEEGDTVKQDRLLIQLDDRLSRYDVNISRALLEEARAQLQESKRQSNELSKLAGSKFIANTAYQAAQAKVIINKAVVKRLQAELKRKQEVLARHRIRAPFEAVVSGKQVEVGQWVKVGDTVMTLVDIKHLRVSVNVPQRFYPLLGSGVKVSFNADALPDQHFTASLGKIIPVADEASHHFPVYIDFDNEFETLTPGMTVKVRLIPASGTGSRLESLSISRDALIKKPDGGVQVWRLKKIADGYQAFPVEVTTGRVLENQVEIVSGQLLPGDRVVTRGNEILKPGQSVRVVP